MTDLAHTPQPARTVRELMDRDIVDARDVVRGMTVQAIQRLIEVT